MESSREDLNEEWGHFSRFSSLPHHWSLTWGSLGMMKKTMTSIRPIHRRIFLGETEDLPNAISETKTRMDKKSTSEKIPRREIHSLDE